VLPFILTSMKVNHRVPWRCSRSSWSGCRSSSSRVYTERFLVRSAVVWGWCTFAFANCLGFSLTGHGTRRWRLRSFQHGSSRRAVWDVRYFLASVLRRKCSRYRSCVTDKEFICRKTFLLVQISNCWYTSPNSQTTLALFRRRQRMSKRHSGIYSTYLILIWFLLWKLSFHPLLNQDKNFTELPKIF